MISKNAAAVHPRDQRSWRLKHSLGRETGLECHRASRPGSESQNRSPYTEFQNTNTNLPHSCRQQQNIRLGSAAANPLSRS